MVTAILVMGAAGWHVRSAIWPQEDRVQPGSYLSIRQVDREDAASLNETAMAQHVPSFPKTLDQMIEEEVKHYRVRMNDTTSSWVAYVDRNLDSHVQPFNYRNHTFQLSTTSIDSELEPPTPDSPLGLSIGLTMEARDVK